MRSGGMLRPRKNESGSMCAGGDSCASARRHSSLGMTRRCASAFVHRGSSQRNPPSPPAIEAATDPYLWLEQAPERALLEPEIGRDATADPRPLDRPQETGGVTGCYRGDHTPGGELKPDACVESASPICSRPGVRIVVVRGDAAVHRLKRVKWASTGKHAGEAASYPSNSMVRKGINGSSPFEGLSASAWSCGKRGRLGATVRGALLRAQSWCLGA